MSPLLLSLLYSIATVTFTTVTIWFLKGLFSLFLCVTIWVFEFCHNLSFRDLSQFVFDFCHNLSFWVWSQFDFFYFCHNLSFWVFAKIWFSIFRTLINKFGMLLQKNLNMISRKFFYWWPKNINHQDRHK